MQFCTRHQHLCANLMLIAIGVGAHLLTGVVFYGACLVIAVLFHGLWMRAMVKRACKAARVEGAQYGAREGINRYRARQATPDHK